VEFEAAALRAIDRFERDTVQVWQANRIYVETMNKKRLPPLSSLIEPKTVARRRRPTAQEQQDAIYLLSHRYGIPLRKGSRHG
jgi:hypothetical protein